MRAGQLQKKKAAIAATCATIRKIPFAQFTPRLTFADWLAFADCRSIRSSNLITTPFAKTISAVPQLTLRITAVAYLNTSEETTVRLRREITKLRHHRLPGALWSKRPNRA